jgi:hypothetical protein
MPIQEKQKLFCLKTENIFHHRSKNVDFECRILSSVFIVFARIGDDKNITGFIVENLMTTEFNEEEHKLGIRVSSTLVRFFNETKVPVENMFLKEGMVLKLQ